MKLGEYHTLEADGSGFTLTYEKEGEVNPQTNKPILTRKIMYYPNLELSLEGYMKHCNLINCNSEEAGLLDVLEKINETYEIIKAACAQLQINKNNFTKVNSTNNE